MLQCGLTVYTKGMNGFDNHRQVSSYFGISPRIVQSGSSVKGRGHICKMGMGHIRMLLYMCARSAKKYNRSCRELYERLLAKGKAKKLALIAVANKLLKCCQSIVRISPGLRKANPDRLDKQCFEDIRWRLSITGLCSFQQDCLSCPMHSQAADRS